MLRISPIIFQHLAWSHMCLDEPQRSTQSTAVFRVKMNEREEEKRKREAERGMEIIPCQTESHPEVKKGRDTNKERSKKTERWKREAGMWRDWETESHTHEHTHAHACAYTCTYTHKHTHKEREEAFEGWIDCFEVRIEEKMAFSCEGGSPRGLPQNQPVWTQLSASEGLQQARSRRAYTLPNKVSLKAT